MKHSEKVVAKRISLNLLFVANFSNNLNECLRNRLFPYCSHLFASSKMLIACYSVNWQSVYITEYSLLSNNIV